MSIDLGYAGKRVVVTGCSSGMGAAVVSALSASGASVVGVDLKEPAGGVDQFFAVDLSDGNSIEASVGEIGSQQLDALFNCAGVPTTLPGPTVVAINFVGLKHLTEALIPSIPAGGAICSVSSAAGLNFAERLDVLLDVVSQDGPEATAEWCRDHAGLFPDGLSGYRFSKECVIVYTMSRGLSLIAERGIRMNCTSPGPTKTPMDAALRAAIGDAPMDALPRPLGRDATAEEQAAALLFLNSPAASAIVGHNLVVDGGTAVGRVLGLFQRPV